MNKIPITDDNRDEVLNSDGNVCVTAGAGSGKTTLLIERLLRKGATASPAEMAVITFTRAAAKEVRDRVERELGESFAKKLKVRTLHGFFYHVLRKDLNVKRTVIDESTEKALFNDLRAKGVIPKEVTLESVKEFAFRKYVIKVVDWLPEKGRSRVLNHFVNPQKSKGGTFQGGNGLSASAVKSEISMEFHDLVKFAAIEFYSLVKKYEFLTFDGIFFEMVNLLKKEKTAERVKKKVRDSVRYLFIDEFQDVDVLQYAVLSKIFKESRTSVFVIGDPMQSIYEWRRAYPYVFELYEEDFKPKSYFLESNYRCAETVVKLINGVRKQYGDGLEQKPKRAVVGEVKIEGVLKFNEDSSYDPKKDPMAFKNRVDYLKNELAVNEHVKKLIETAEKEKKTVAILCRTNVEKNFTYSKLKSRYTNVLKENRYYQLSKEVSAVLSAIGLALKPQLTGTSFVHGLLTKKYEGVGSKSFIIIQEAIKEVNGSDRFKVYEELEKKTLYEKVYDALKAKGLKGKRLSKLTETAVRWISDLNEVRKEIESPDSTVKDVFFKVDEVFEVSQRSYEQDLKEIKKKRLKRVVTVEEKVQTLEMVADVASNYLKSKYLELLQDGEVEPTKADLFGVLAFDKGGFEDYLESFVNEGGFVKIMTIHQSKGREFDFVIFPVTYDLLTTNVDEDKRLLYVALSRARDSLMVIGDPGLCQKLKDCLGSSPSPKQ